MHDALGGLGTVTAHHMHVSGGPGTVTAHHMHVSGGWGIMYMSMIDLEPIEK